MGSRPLRAVQRDALVVLAHGARPKANPVVAFFRHYTLSLIFPFADYRFSTAQAAAQITQSSESIPELTQTVQAVADITVLEVALYTVVE